MKVKLLAYTPNPLNIIQTACKTCYSAVGPIELAGQNIINMKLIEQVYKSGHLSTFEHVNFTFAIEAISRACSHQLVRHRHASFSQQSQRYVNMSECKFVIPASIRRENKETIEKELYKLVCFYGDLVDDKIKKEDARCILPNCTATNLVMTCNLRELIHICNLRLCTRAQREIRTLVQKMVEEVLIHEPWLKPYLVPQCDRDGFCKEHNCCGRKKKLCN